MKVFVTGATGLIGAGTVRALVAAGHQVTGLTSREGGVNKILDVICYSIPKVYKQAADEAFEISKQLKLDPRKSYTDAAKDVSKVLGEDFRDLPEEEIRKNETRVISGAEARFEMLKDKKSSSKV